MDERVRKKTSGKDIYREVEGHYVVKDHLVAARHSLRVKTSCSVNERKSRKSTMLAVVGKCDDNTNKNNDALSQKAALGLASLSSALQQHSTNTLYKHSIQILNIHVEIQVAVDESIVQRKWFRHIKSTVHIYTKIAVSKGASTPEMRIPDKCDS